MNNIARNNIYKFNHQQPRRWKYIKNDYTQTNNTADNNIYTITVVYLSLIVHYQDGYDKSRTMCIAI